MSMKKTTFLAIALLSGAYMNGAEQAPKGNENKDTFAQCAWKTCVTAPYNVMTFEGYEHSKAAAARKEFGKEPVQGQEISKEDKDRFDCFNTNYDATNYKRFLTSLAVSVVSGGAGAVSLYLTRGTNVDPNLRKAQMAAGFVAATSLVTAAGLRWKAEADVNKAMQAATDLKFEKTEG